MVERQKILIVDDKKANLIALRQALRCLDVEIFEATSGNEALAATLDNDFAVALLDVMMPGMNGYELAEHLRGDNKTKVIPLVFLTASYADEQHMFRGYEVGGIDYIVKPFDQTVLIQKVKIFLELDRNRSELKRHRDNLEVMVAERTAQLADRVKEMRCLSGVKSIVADSKKSFDEVLEAVGTLIPQGWQYPENACAGINLNGGSFSTPNFRDTSWKQTADIIVSGKAFGSVEVGYLEEKPPVDEGPFLSEERDLLESIAKTIAGWVERKHARSRLEHLNRMLRSLRDVNKLIVHEKDPQRLIQEACNILTGTLSYNTAWIVLTGEYDSATMSALAEKGELLDSMDERIKNGNLPTCIAGALNGKETLLLDSRTDCAGCPLAAFEEGKISLITRLEYDGKIYGAIGVSAPLNHVPDEEELGLYEEFSGDISFALYKIGIERRHEQYARIVANARDAMALIAPDYTYLEVNPSFENMIGRPAAEIVGHPVSEVLGEKFFLKTFKARLDQCLGGETVRFQTLRKIPNAGQRFIEAVYSPCYAPDGSVIAVAVSLRDVTEFRQVEESLKRSRGMLARTEGVAHIGSWEWEIATDTVMWSEELFRIFQLDPDDGAPSWADHPKLYHPEDFEALRQAVEVAVTNGTPYEIELRAFRKDGETRLCQAKGFAELGKNGKLVRLFGSLHDITERKMIEDRLRINEERFRSFFENAPEYCYIVSPDGMILDVNRAATDALECKKEDLLGMPVEQFYAPESKERLKELYASLRKKDRIDNEEMFIVTKDGDKRTVLLSMSCVYSDDGALNQTISVQRDVTELKSLEMRLEQAQKMESIGRLAGGVAHDFNNMLSIITGYTELALDSIGEHDPIRADLDEVLTASRRARDLTRQLLTFARRQPIQPEILDLNECVENSRKMLSRLIGEDIDLQCIPGEGLWNVRLDPSQIDQILANLAINSRDAISGVGSIIIETANVVWDEDSCKEYSEYNPGEYVQLNFSDTGKGMDKETVKNIFEPFFTTKPMGKGTGLGLSTIYGIVKQNDGFINVYSEPGQGATFKIYLPRTTQDAVDRTAEPDKKSLTGTETILVVEDEKMISELCQRILEGYGYRVIAARLPEEAVESAKNHAGEIHLMITDVVMPTMNGKELKEKIDEFNPDMKILFMSGYTANVIVKRGVLAKGVNFIQKPFSQSGLAEKVRRVLDKKD